MNNINTRIENQIIINSVEGSVGPDAIVEHIKMNVGSWIGKPVVWDFTEALLSEVAVVEMRKLVEKLKPLSEKKRGEKTAFVSSNELHFSMIKLLKELTKKANYDIEIQVFGTHIEAKEWLLKKE